MNKAIRKIVVVGGGTAGWITAGLIAARHPDRSENGVQITLIESPDVPTIGVGEGTWPTIRKTLSRIGIREADFLRACDASFKQGSRFDGWVSGTPEDSYHHPFDLPVSQYGTDLIHAWTSFAGDRPFAEAVCAQVGPGLDGLAPRQSGMPDFIGATNYAYHLDAVKLATLLREHVLGQLGVTYIQDHVTEVVAAPDGDISSVKCREVGPVEGDLFVDCTGQASLLLGQHYGVEFVDQSRILFNDRAVIAQVPVAPDSQIASQTISTAHEAGWIWDIGLPTRRGVGCVYASGFMSADVAEATLREYIGPQEEVRTRHIQFRSGHRKTFWQNNCVAIGLSAGFLEPLEASAIVMVELSAEMIAENLPVTRAAMNFEADRFNATFRYRWSRIIDFLKLHYVLSRRTDPYWQENRKSETIPDRLKSLLQVWQYRPPAMEDFEHASEVFSVSSYLFVAYGMGMRPQPHPTLQPRQQAELCKEMQTIARKQRSFASGLPTNRAYLSAFSDPPVRQPA